MLQTVQNDQLHLASVRTQVVCERARPRELAFGRSDRDHRWRQRRVGVQERARFGASRRIGKILGPIVAAHVVGAAHRDKTLDQIRRQRHTAQPVALHGDER